jgi:predicted fused transcriptional regulator/phosphomethylpyrimidine kinase
MTKDNAESSEDVASFLNGLIIADEKVTGINGIQFGKSKHLSSLLLYIKDKLDVNAIMNIAYSASIKKTGFRYSSLTKDFKLKNCKNSIDILLHEGDFGIEPCAYILGNDAVDVVNKIIKIKEEKNEIK